MKIVIAPDSFKESLSALQVAEAIEAGLREVFADADIVKLPVADGGEGTVQAMIDATGGRRVELVHLGTGQVIEEIEKSADVGTDEGLGHSGDPLAGV